MSAQIVGQRDWQAPDQLRIKREPGFGYRYIKKLDVERRLDEGWEIVSSPLRQHKEGGPVEKAQHYRGLILMRMPLEMIEQRNAHYQGLHKRRLRAVARGGALSSVLKAATHEGMETEDGRPLAGAIGRGLVVRQGSISDDGALIHTDNINIPVAVHPDDLREDLKVAEEMQAEKAAAIENGEGEAPKVPSKPNKKRR